MELKANGKIRHIGMSTHNPEVAKLAVESDYVEMIMISINPAFDMMPAMENVDSYFGGDYTGAGEGIAPERSELYKLCEQRDVGLTVMKGFAGGRLFDEKRSPFGVALTPIQCLHYCLTRPAVASVLPGYDTLEHIDAAVAYESADDMAKDYASVLAGAPLHAYKGECTYCGHCKPCPMDIDIAMVNKLYDLAIMQQEVPGSVKDHYRLLSMHAGDCIGCRSCESRCPFGVRIAERMRKTADVFGL